MGARVCDLGERGVGAGFRHYEPSVEQNKRGKVGYADVHSLVDDSSRLGYSEVLADEKGACAAILQRAAALFASLGIIMIERVMTDNAWAYRHSRDARTV